MAKSTEPVASVVTKQRYRPVFQQLSVAQKPSKGAPAYSRYINRPLGRRLAAAAYVLGLTPNAVTYISAICTFSGLLLVVLVPPAWWLGIVVSALLVLGYALDSADGQVARLRGGGSLEGEWLDHTIDAAKITLVHLAVILAAYRYFDVSEAWLLVPLGFLLVDNVKFFGTILKDLLIARHAARAGVPVPQVAGGTRRSFLMLPTDYGVQCLAFLLLGVPTVFFVFYTGLFAATAAFLLLALVKWYHDMKALTQ